MREVYPTSLIYNIYLLEPLNNKYFGIQHNHNLAPAPDPRSSKLLNCVNIGKSIDHPLWVILMSGLDIQVVYLSVGICCYPTTSPHNP